jgi:hypothetical protein
VTIVHRTSRAVAYRPVAVTRPLEFSEQFRLLAANLIQELLTGLLQKHPIEAA